MRFSNARLMMIKILSRQAPHAPYGAGAARLGWGRWFDLLVGVVRPLPPPRTHSARCEGAVRGCERETRHIRARG
jgi:hypothetical protein